MLSMHELSLSMPEPMLSLSMLIFLGILLLRWKAQFETQIKTDIPEFQHVDFLCFWVVLAYLAKCSRPTHAAVSSTEQWGLTPPGGGC